MTSEDGDTFIVKAGPKHEIIGTNSIGEPVYARRRSPMAASSSAARRTSTASVVKLLCGTA